MSHTTAASSLVGSLLEKFSADASESRPAIVLSDAAFGVPERLRAFLRGSTTYLDYSDLFHIAAAAAVGCFCRGTTSSSGHIPLHGLRPGQSVLCSLKGGVLMVIAWLACLILRCPLALLAPRTDCSADADFQSYCRDTWKIQPDAWLLHEDAVLGAISDGFGWIVRHCSCARCSVGRGRVPYSGEAREGARGVVAEPRTAAASVGGVEGGAGDRCVDEADTALLLRTLEGACPPWCAVCADSAFDARGASTRCETSECVLRDPCEAAWIVTTSGSSTGVPKLVVAGRAGVAAYVAGRTVDECLGPSSAILLASAFTFDPAIGDFVTALKTGAALVLPVGPTDTDTISHLASPSTNKALLRGIPYYDNDVSHVLSITHITTTPVLLAAILANQTPSSCCLLNSASSLRVLAIGGERLSDALAAAVECTYCERRRITAPVLRNVYGLTEGVVYQAWGNVFRSFHGSQQSDTADSRSHASETPMGGDIFHHVTSCLNNVYEPQSIVLRKHDQSCPWRLEGDGEADRAAHVSADTCCCSCLGFSTGITTLAVGDVVEILLSAPQLALGYILQSEVALMSTVPPDPCSKKNYFYLNAFPGKFATGDFATVAHDSMRGRYLRLIGRRAIDTQVKIHGERVDTCSTEAGILMHGAPAITAVNVVPAVLNNALVLVSFIALRHLAGLSSGQCVECRSLHAEPSFAWEESPSTGTVPQSVLRLAPTYIHRLVVRLFAASSTVVPAMTVVICRRCASSDIREVESPRGDVSFFPVTRNAKIDRCAMRATAVRAIEAFQSSDDLMPIEKRLERLGSHVMAVLTIGYVCATLLNYDYAIELHELVDSGCADITPDGSNAADIGFRICHVGVARKIFSLMGGSFSQVGGDSLLGLRLTRFVIYLASSFPALWACSWTDALTACSSALHRCREGLHIRDSAVSNVCSAGFRGSVDLLRGDTTGPLSVVNLLKSSSLQEYVIGSVDLSVCTADCCLSCCTAEVQSKEESSFVGPIDAPFDEFHSAVASRDAIVLDALLRMDRLPLELGLRGKAASSMPLLHRAILTGDDTLVAVLLRYNAPMNVLDPSGAMPLHVAAAHSPKLLAILLEKCPSLRRARNSADQGLEHYAARAGRLDCLQVMFPKATAGCFSKNSPEVHGLTSMDRWMRTPLHWAIVLGHTEVVEWLLFVGISPVGPRVRPGARNKTTRLPFESPLELARRYQNEMIVHLLEQAIDEHR